MNEVIDPSFRSFRNPILPQS
jgi:hypothetical protein